MNNISNLQPNKNNIFLNDNASDIGVRNDFSSKLEKLNDEIKSKNPDDINEEDKEILTDEKQIRPVNYYDQETSHDDREEDETLLQSVSHISTPIAGNNFQHSIQSSITTIHSIQEFSVLLEKYFLSSSTQIHSAEKTWLINYSDDNGLYIDFKLQRISNSNFSLSCNIDLQNMKNYFFELNEKLNRKGWSLISDNVDNSIKILKVPANYN